MNTKLLSGLAALAIAMSLLGCPTKVTLDEVCNTKTTLASCVQTKDAATQTNCVWFKDEGVDKCGVRTSPTDPLPQEVSCAEITVAADCNAHVVGTTPCFFNSLGTCVSVANCGVATNEPDCTGINPLVQGGCSFVGAACVENPLQFCAYTERVCENLSTNLGSNQTQCEAIIVNGTAVCRWTGGRVFGGTCEFATPLADPCEAAADQAACESAAFSSACTFR